MTANPDLLFDEELAVADVKYKLSGKEWRRPDLYQSVAFAAAARTRYAAIVGFLGHEQTDLAQVSFGDISVQTIDWLAEESVAAEAAADDLAARIEAWLQTCTGSVGTLALG